MAENAAGQEDRAIKRISCEVYSRIVGYLRPVQAWNEGKQQEFLERQTYDMARSIGDAQDSAATRSRTDR